MSFLSHKAHKLVLICFLSHQPDTSLHCKTMNKDPVHFTACLFSYNSIYWYSLHEKIARLSLPRLLYNVHVENSLNMYKTQPLIITM